MAKRKTGGQGGSNDNMHDIASKATTRDRRACLGKISLQRALHHDLVVVSFGLRGSGVGSCVCMYVHLYILCLCDFEWVILGLQKFWNSWSGIKPMSFLPFLLLLFKSLADNCSLRKYLGSSLQILNTASLLPKRHVQVETLS